MVYKIKDYFLEVINKIQEFEEIIYGRFSQFEKVKDKKAENYLKFTNEGVEIKINKQEKFIKGKIIKTDIYVVINNVISLIINDENNIYIHSVVISNSKHGILIVGNFGQGKTTLANEFLKYGYKINSTDQTWLKIENYELRLVLGSRFYFEDKKIKFIEEMDSKEKVKINKIIRIVGLCDNGIPLIEEQTKGIYKIKQISDYCNWTNITPIFTDDIDLYDVRKYTKNFLSKIFEITFYNVRGDKQEISKRLK